MPLDSSVEGDYLVLVSRSAERLSVELWPVKLRESLPKIPIPQKPQDADAVVDLQQGMLTISTPVDLAPHCSLAKPNGRSGLFELKVNREYQSLCNASINNHPLLSAGDACRGRSR